MKSETQTTRPFRPGSLATCAIALTLGIFLFSGCKSNSPAKEIVGHWTVDTSQAGNSDSLKNNPLAAGFMKLVTLDFTSDGKFTEMSMIGGTYTLNGRQVLLHADSIMGITPPGKDKAQDQYATLSDDGKTLRVTNKGETMVFVKSPDK